MKSSTLILATFLISPIALAQPPVGGAGQMPTNEVIMERNDENKDGEITKAEAEEAKTQLGTTFDTFDLNKDGKVTAAELDTMRASMAGGSQ